MIPINDSEYWNDLSMEGRVELYLDSQCVIGKSRIKFKEGAMWAAKEILRVCEQEVANKPKHLPYVHLDVLTNIIFKD